MTPNSRSVQSGESVLPKDEQHLVTLMAGFDLIGIDVPLAKLLPTRVAGEKVKASKKYKALLASVREVGIIEPLSVFPDRGGTYLLLDGHSRLEALKEMGAETVPCLISKTNEAYTYNQKVNRIAPVQANRMILKALNAGVPEERVAKALNLSVHTVKTSRSLLHGICPEAVDLLRDRHVAKGTFSLLKKVKAMRQIEIAEIMVSAGNYQAHYARALVLNSPKEQLVDPEGARKIAGAKAEDFARLEHEMKVQEKDFRAIDESYNDQVMELTIARAYLRSLLEKAKVVRYLSASHPELLAEFQRIVETSTLEG